MCKCNGVCVTAYVNPCSDTIDTNIPSAGVDEVIVYFDGVGSKHSVTQGSNTIELPRSALNEHYKHRVVTNAGGVETEYCLKTKIVKNA